MPKLDSMYWHLSGGEFPPDLPEENAATHIGLFVAWAINSSLWGPPSTAEEQAAIQLVRDRVITGRAFVIEHCDGKLFPDMLNAQGGAFALKYYERDYSNDYKRFLIGDLSNDYLVEDTWENYERIAEVIGQRFAKYRKRPWWQLW